MSPSMRILYFVVLGLSLLSVWFGVHELAQVPLGNIQGIAMVSIGMLMLGWVIAHPARPLTDLDANSLQHKFAIRFDPVAQALLAKPLIYVGMFIGWLTVALSTKPALQPALILILWTAGMVIFLVGTATPGIRLK